LDSPVQRRAQQRAQKAVMTFATAWNRAFEVAGVTAVFLLFGLWLDSIFGTKPLCIIVFVLLAWFGLGARLYYGYKADMAREEEGKPWMRNTR
jgi:F0F1-type ATP synthase assembly protein I